ncbi:MAG: ATP synthase subunit I [Ruminococcus sp.]|nr:ATP synthase subunit I [Ruminococcus sp.]
MKFGFLSNMINEQLSFLLPKAFIADALIFIAALPFYGLDHTVALGLLLGTAAMTANILLLGISAEHAVERGSAKAAKRCMFSFYIIRFTIMGAALVLGFNSVHCNSVCTFIPLLYPKTFYTAGAILEQAKERKRRKDK